MIRGIQRYTVFDTAAGNAAIGWNGRGVSSIRLPAHGADAAERALLRRLPLAERSAPPPWMVDVIDAARRYFAGERVGFDDVPVDLGEQETVFSDVYVYVRRLGWGETTTYGAVARAVGGGPEVARDVGQAMARNPVPLIVPCHRVLAANGRIGGFSAPGGAASKARMLMIENVVLEKPKAPANVPSTQLSMFS